ncbi:MAG: methyltransferase domain-containing protein [Candidatus Hydrogenedens sp.]|nr:methyltransferase domain-containing protein [Candidatus Hydrogenedens sp.]
MSDTRVSTLPFAAISAQADRLARSIFLRAAGAISQGEIVLHEADGVTHLGSKGSQPSAHVWIHDPAFYRRTLTGGLFAAVDAYAEGVWSCDDLPALLEIITRNQSLQAGFDAVGGRILAPLRRLRHALRANTRSGSRRNIAAHYDLGNDFFSLFLDETMMYSSAYFPNEEASLVEASTEKNDRLCRKLQLRPEDHLLEIGTGWGGFALHAASRYGCRVTTTTISKEQHAKATERIAAAGLSDRVTLLLEDYRDLRGRYDKIVSIEMIEAVGYEYFDTFFGQCSRLLKRDGLFALQAITTGDQGYLDYVRSNDFIREYIFPGGCLTSHGSMLASAGRATDMRLLSSEDFGAHYARTTRLWRERMKQNLDKIRGLGYGDAFLRIWELYLASCEAGFTVGNIGVSHLLFAKPGYRPAL